MKPLKILACGLIVLTGCTSTAYEKQATAFKESFDTLTGARKGLRDRTVTASSTLVSGNEERALRRAAPILSGTGCVTNARNAEAAAVAAKGQSLDAIYVGQGPLADPASCWIAFAPPKPPKSRTQTAPDTAAIAKERAKELEEARADEALCRSRTRGQKGLEALPPGAEPPKEDAAPARSDGTKPVKPPEESEKVWAAIEAYAAGLPALASAETEKEASAAVGETRDAVAGIGKSLELKGSVYTAVVNLLFLGIEKAIQQRRYEAFKTAVVCANPIFIEARPILRDYMRYEQIAAYDVRSDALRLQFNALDMQFNPADAGTDCGSFPDRCRTRDALDIVRNTKSSPESVFIAWSYLDSRTERLRPQLKAAQTEAAAVNALGRADPAAAVDAFVLAHRKLRDDVMTNKGQSKALRDSLKAFRDAAEALDEALNPKSETEAK